MTRAERRAQVARAKARAKKQLALWRLGDQSCRRIGIFARTRKPCSCPGCGNRRKHEGPPVRELRWK